MALKTKSLRPVINTVVRINDIITTNELFGSTVNFIL